jgi:hypothetical protein
VDPRRVLARVRARRAAEPFPRAASGNRQARRL